MNNVVVVGVDGSETAAQAAREAAELAAALGARLHLVTAVEATKDEVVGVGDDLWLLSSTDSAKGVANEEAAKLRGVVAEITVAAGEGKPHEVIIAEAERLDARLIVVGNRRMRGIGRVLGSVANSVAHNAPCGVYIAKTV
jgi:nucleotide-binding universal stress UspA family protein